MSFIRYKRFGNKEYAYEITAYWDPVEKKPRQKTRYLGLVVDKEKGVYKRKEPKERPEKLILDFGDVHLLYEFMKQADLVSLLDRIFGDKTRYLLALLCYRLCYASAMSYAGVWYEGSISRFLFRDVNLSSQRISDFLKSIGEERVQRDFFERYLAPFMDAKEGVIIDTTALPNQIHFPFNAWGYDDGEIDKQVRFLLWLTKIVLCRFFSGICQVTWLMSPLSARPWKNSKSSALRPAFSFSTQDSSRKTTLKVCRGRRSIFL
jgi:hypothetical protein